ncbi:MAG: hypothetical protein Q8O40_06260 [Chloroflexota bacterium]|nr:hypothetical protein [Chloroflexota bacterium]
MSDNAQVYIAGWKTPADWAGFRETLAIGGEAEPWRRAFKEFFRTRLDLRYFNPIRILQDHGTLQGEGFSILALQCTLIEFLESTVQGVNYRFLRHGEKLGPHEYSSSSDLFVGFLCTREPFARDFDKALARDFYTDVRCGLLHEACTKGGWRVWAESPDGAVINPKLCTVYRNNLQKALDEFIRWYEAELPKNADLQKAFIRKLDYLCQEAMTS